MMSNTAIAARLLAYARSLRDRDPNFYRKGAYRRAADTVMRLERSVASILDEKGRSGLLELPGIGRHLACTIERLVRTGEFRTLTSARRTLWRET
jgi:DNA polymerase/3'-5' exonuclease PolX